MGNLGPTEVILFLFLCLFFFGVYRFFFWGRIKNTNNLNVAVNLAPSEKENLSSDKLSDLERLAKLREQGHISDAEFEAQKRKLLG